MSRRPMPECPELDFAFRCVQTPDHGFWKEHDTIGACLGNIGLTIVVLDHESHPCTQSYPCTHLSTLWQDARAGRLILIASSQHAEAVLGRTYATPIDAESDAEAVSVLLASVDGR